MDLLTFESALREWQQVLDKNAVISDRDLLQKATAKCIGIARQVFAVLYPEILTM